MDCLKAVIKLCNVQNFCITTICGNGDFEPMKDVLKTECNIELNPMSVNEHVAETKRMMCMVKEWMHAAFSGFLWKKVVKETTHDAVMMIDAFPLKSSMCMHLSSHNVMVKIQSAKGIFDCHLIVMHRFVSTKNLAMAQKNAHWRPFVSVIWQCTRWSQIHELTHQLFN